MPTNVPAPRGGSRQERLDMRGRPPWMPHHCARPGANRRLVVLSTLKRVGPRLSAGFTPGNSTVFHR
eukprot:4731818-Heterocapsa_arctica.AAC.1